MMWSMLLLIFLTLAAGFAGWLLFLWAVKSGQYDDIEGPKYRMLDDDEDEQVKQKTGHEIKELPKDQRK
jgi:cbb3-type cytochrome oxidase maturation protein